MSKPGTPVICLETEERFESMKEAMERYGVSSGSLNSALTYGYSTGGYHFYRADEPKPDDSFFKSGNGGKGSSKKRPVICLETGVQFESAIAALKWLDSGKTNNRGNMRTALISGSALLGYHFYYADEPKPPNSHFKRAVYCEDLDTVFTSLETCADAIGFNGSISDLADKVANGTVVKGHRLGFVGVDRKPLPNGDKWKPAVTDAKRENMQVGRVSSPLYGKQSVKPARLQEWLGTICEYENAVSKPATERITGIRPDGAIFLRRQIAATELLSLADRYGEYLDFADEAADFAPFLYDASFSTRGAYLKVSSPGNIYREAGFPQDPFFYTYNHLRDALVPKGFYPSTVRVRHPHGLTLEQIKRLPELLERPVVLMDSDRDDTMIAVLADVDEDGFPLIAALRPGGNAVSEGRSVGGTIVCSFYGKPENYFRFKMQQMPQRVLYQDIEKGRELDARAKLQLFGGNIASPDLDRRIIRPPECIVKLRADTPQTETHGRETSRVRRESRDMASGRAALDAGRRAETARVTERHIDSNLK